MAQEAGVQLQLWEWYFCTLFYLCAHGMGTHGTGVRVMCFHIMCVHVTGGSVTGPLVRMLVLQHDSKLQVGSATSIHNKRTRN